MRWRGLTPILTIALVAGACYRSARPFAPVTFDRQPGWVSVGSVPVVRQHGALDCGAAAAAMLLGFWGLPATQEGVRLASGVPPERGLEAAFLRTHLRDRGLEAYLFEGTMDDFVRELERGRPVLVGVVRKVSNKLYSHYLIVAGVHRAREEVVVVDPAEGWSVYSFGGFQRQWKAAHQLTMTVFAPPRR